MLNLIIPILLASNLAISSHSGLSEKSDSLNSLVTPDLVLFELHGPVNSVTYHTDNSSSDWTGSLIPMLYDEIRITFDGEGTWDVPPMITHGKSSGDVNPLHPYERNDDGQITEYYRWTEFFAAPSKYKWENGRPVSCEWKGIDGSGTDYYTYDDKGNLSKKLTKSFLEGEAYTTTIIYFNYEYDERGNWISRNWESVEDDYGKEYSIEKRTIQYY